MPPSHKQHDPGGTDRQSWLRQRRPGWVLDSTLVSIFRWEKFRTFQQLTGEFKDRIELGAWLPEVWLEHAQTHGARVWRRIIGDIGMVDFGGEADSWWLEGIVGR